MNQLKKDIIEIKKELKNNKDEINKIILEDILLKKINEYRNLKILNEIKIKKEKENIESELDSKLDRIIEFQKEEHEEIKNDAYNKLIENNELEFEKEKEDKYWNKKIDPKYKKEVESDFSNNKLMDRLNSELDFRIEGNKKNVIKPYLNNDEKDDNNYVNIKKFKNHSIPSNNFSNDRLLGSRKNL